MDTVFILFHYIRYQRKWIIISAKYYYIVHIFLMAVNIYTTKHVCLFESDWGLTLDLTKSIVKTSLDSLFLNESRLVFCYNYCHIIQHSCRVQLHFHFLFIVWRESFFLMMASLTLLLTTLVINVAGCRGSNQGVTVIMFNATLGQYDFTVPGDRFYHQVGALSVKSIRPAGLTFTMRVIHLC